jgi:peptide/nickel transport system substrate-binding protein
MLGAGLLTGPARLAAAPRAAQDAAAKPGGTFITAKTTEAPSLDPQTQGSVSRQLRTSLIYSNLLRLDANLERQPDLAESYEVSEDGKQVSFRLRQGVKWHPPVSRELVADDVKFSYERLIAESPGKSSFASIQDIEVVDSHTVTFHLSQPDAGLLESMASSWYGSIVNRETVEQHGDLNNTAVGTGPFIVEEWAVDNELRLRKNPDYFVEGRPYVDQVLIKVIPDESNIVAGLRSNTIHHATLEDNLLFDLLEGEGNLTTFRSQRLGFELMNINNSVPPFDKLQVRQAMSAAIDRAELINVVAGGHAQLTAPASPALKQWQLPEEQWKPFYQPDLDKAKQLLAEAGLPNGFASKLTIITGYPTMASGAQVIQANLKRIGIDLEIESLEAAVWAPRSLSKDPNEWFPLMLNITPGWTDPDHYFYRWFHSGALNINNWSDPEVDALVAEGRATLDFAQRKAIYDKVQLLFLERIPMTWHFSPELIDVTQNYVQGYWQHPTSYPLSFSDVWLDQ